MGLRGVRRRLGVDLAAVVGAAHGRGAVTILVGVCVFTHDASGCDSGTCQPRRTSPFIAAP